MPHERTMSKPKDDRLNLMRACRANLSAIWVLSLAQGLSARAYLYTDRPAYRPGHDVELRGNLLCDRGSACAQGDLFISALHLLPA